MAESSSLSPKTIDGRRRKNHAPRRWLRWVVILLGACALVAGVLWAWMPRPVLVDVAQVVNKPLKIWIKEDGQARVRERYTVSAPLSGSLVRLDWEPGDVIEEGAVVAQLLPPDPGLLDARTRAEATARLQTATARQKQLAAAVKRAKTARDGALREAARGKALEGTLSQAERDRLDLMASLAVEDVAAAELAYRVAGAEVQAARATLGQVKRGGEPIQVVAPANGQVLRVYRKSEGPVAAGTPLLDFGDPAALEVVVDVLSSDAARIRVGAPVRLSQWGETETLEGHVRLVEPAAFTHVSALGVEEQRVNVIVSLKNGAVARLGDGYRVDAEILVWQSDSALVIPNSAIFREAGHWATYVVEQGVAVRKSLELGEQSQLEAQVMSGLAPGVQVVLYPGRRVASGTRVQPRP